MKKLIVILVAVMFFASCNKEEKLRLLQEKQQKEFESAIVGFSDDNKVLLNEFFELCGPISVPNIGAIVTIPAKEKVTFTDKFGKVFSGVLKEDLYIIDYGGELLLKNGKLSDKDFQISSRILFTVKEFPLTWKQDDLTSILEQYPLNVAQGRNGWRLLVSNYEEYLSTDFTGCEIYSWGPKYIVILGEYIFLINQENKCWYRR